MEREKRNRQTKWRKRKRGIVEEGKGHEEGKKKTKENRQNTRRNNKGKVGEVKKKKDGGKGRKKRQKKRKMRIEEMGKSEEMGRKQAYVMGEKEGRITEEKGKG